MYKQLILFTTFTFIFTGTCLHEPKPKSLCLNPLVYFWLDCATGPEWPVKGSQHRGWSCYSYATDRMEYFNEPISGPCILLDIDRDGDVDLKDYWRLQQ